MIDTSNEGFVAIGFPRGGHEGIERHFADHRKDFRGITIEAYEKKAIALLSLNLNKIKNEASGIGGIR
jgi:hypothetical protein